ncbi:major facilitator superfamily domain-containing protein [Globomyces pollinis-pini]|nr:major facilitator superfamily domain-containing protein [Globomyces pollinis-pini]
MLESIRSSKAFVLLVVSLGLFIDTFAYTVVMPFIPFVIEDIGGDPKDIGLILIWFSVGIIIGSITFGILTDKLKQKRSLMIMGLMFLAIATIVMIYIKSFLSLSIGRFFQGIASGSVWVLGLSLLADSYDQSELGTPMGFVMVAFTLGNFVGPICGGFLYQFGGYQAPFWATLGLVVLDLLLRLAIIEPSPVPDTVMLEEESISKLLTKKPLIMLLAICAGAGIFISAIEVTLPLYLEEHYGYTSGQIGLVFIAFVIPELIFAPLSGAFYDKFGFIHVVLPGMLLTALTVAFLQFEMDSWLFIGGLALFGGAVATCLSPLLPELSYCSPAASYGRLYGLFNVAFAVGLFIGPLLGSMTFQYWGWKWQCISISGVVVLILPLILFYQRPKVLETSVVIA